MFAELDVCDPLGPIQHGVVYTGHYETLANGRNRFWLRHAKRSTAIIPLRHPARVRRSHEVRQDTWPGSTIKTFYRQWLDMMIFAETCPDIMWLHLDCPELREGQANMIMSRLGISKRIDWTPSKESGCFDIDADHMAPITDELMANIPQSYVDFYEAMKSATLRHRGDPQQERQA